ncbi:MAG: CBS domain-containing protein [Deltaproteobacteria bacterium]|nr:CBS domain-containing protein [Deltaproteobacteria bacterium]
MMKITAEEIITDIGEEPLCVSPETVVYDAVKAMLERDIHAVLVQKDGKYVGIWTERDLMKNTVLEGFDPKTTRVGDHASFPLKSAPHTDTIFQLIDKLLGYQTRHLLIEKEGKYIGLLYSRDVIRVGFTERTKQLRELDEMVSLEFYENWKWKKKHK